MKNLNYKKILILSALFSVPFFVDSQVRLDTNATVDSANPVKVEAVVKAESQAVVTEESTAGSGVQATTQNTRTTTNTTEVKTNAEIKELTDALQGVKEAAKVTESEIRSEIKSGIDKSIIDIRSQKDIEAYELQRAVDDTRNEIYQEIENTFKESVKPIQVDVIEQKIENALSDIENSLKSYSQVDVNLEENRRSIKNTLLKYEEQIRENREIINQREGELTIQDTDGDGLSDYDEKNIYKTDPNKSSTTGGGLSDGEKVAQGINPTSDNLEPINFSDPREDQEAFVSELYTVNKVELQTEGEKTQLKFEGQALPNSFITLYIFSTPIIVTVKTDERGEWQYTLDKELEDGSHDVYVATVDNSGKIVAKSNPIPFTKTAQAAVLGSVNIGNDKNVPSGNFFEDNFMFIAIGIVLLAILLALMFTGNKKIPKV